MFGVHNKEMESCKRSPYSPFVVVSNRLPFKVKEHNEPEQGVIPSSGGLVTALLPVIKAVNGTWIGTLGCSKTGMDDTFVDLSSFQSDYRLKNVNIKTALNDKFYNDVCNGCFWPLFHSMPERAIFVKDHEYIYDEINKSFTSETLSELSRYYEGEEEPTTPVVWIHDFHLLLMPKHLQKLLKSTTYDCRILFFLHIPFPPIDVLRLLPWHRAILQSLLACHLVGFQTQTDRNNFVDACKTSFGCEIDECNDDVYFHGRTCRVGYFPIAIPYNQFRSTAETLCDMNMFEGCKIILGVDRMDYTKGLLEKLRAFEHLLETFPAYQEKLMLIQIAVPSRENVLQYRKLKPLIDQEVGRINGRFSTLTWTPIRYLYREVPQSRLCCLYRRADVAAITPIRDGMNLVAKEFVACQVREPGVLVLSKFAGSAETMKEAILVNPLDQKELTEAFRTALEMRKEEKKERMDALKSREKMYDIYYWFNSFMDRAVSLINDTSIYLSRYSFEEYLGTQLSNTEHISLLLDYDGTLAPIASTPSEARLPSNCMEVLLALKALPSADIAIISGRSLKDLKQIVGIDGITYAGNHGLHIHSPFGETFAYSNGDQLLQLVQRTCKELNNSLSSKEAWVENKGTSLALHFRNVNDEEKKIDIVKNAHRVIDKNGLIAKRGKCVIEGLPTCNWNKGDAALFILEEQFGKNWFSSTTVIAVGDDVTDEDTFNALKNKALTFKVVHKNDVPSAADFKLHGTEEVFELLKWILERSEP